MIFVWIAAAVGLCFGLVVLRGAPYVPTHRRQIEAAFSELYKLSSSDTMVDLGCGDGLVLSAARSRGAKAVGYELNPLLTLWCRLRFWRSEQVSVVWSDYTRAKSLPTSTTLVYAFTTGHSIDAIGRKLVEWSQARPIHFISYGFELGDQQPVASRGPMHLYRFGP